MRHVSPLRGGVSLLLLLHTASSMLMLPNSTGWAPILDKYLDEKGDFWEAKQRGKRAITDSDAQLILDLHNKLRGQVYPPSSNMEYMGHPGVKYGKGMQQEDVSITRLTLRGNHQRDSEITSIQILLLFLLLFICFLFFTARPPSYPYGSVPILSFSNTEAQKIPWISVHTLQRSAELQCSSVVVTC
ncbi:hypothetical protein F7725_028496 [Dissostichus mawsoni]|uniref:Uncharacterized protein n=1 Tax=Dissostichus mawsoni TaxID=36200 RepID=A0A7J5XIB4_DISMA|nr:hypothetical protein F7725_028496 [Dissostichus mawsoni]